MDFRQFQVFGKLMNIKLLELTQSLADRTSSVSDVLVIIAHRTHNEIFCLFLDGGVTSFISSH